MHPGNPTDDPHFISRSAAPATGTAARRSPPTYHKVEQADEKGSQTTRLDKLPRALVSALPGFGLRVLVGFLEALAFGSPVRLLSAVLLLCLAKKLRTWLMRNRRPIILEPYLQRVETGVMQDRRVTRRDLRRAVPPEHFAYWRQLSG